MFYEIVYWKCPENSSKILEKYLGKNLFLINVQAEDVSLSGIFLISLFICSLCYLYVIFLEAEKNFRAQQQQQQQQQTKKDQIIHFL